MLGAVVRFRSTATEGWHGCMCILAAYEDSRFMLRARRQWLQGRRSGGFIDAAPSIRQFAKIWRPIVDWTAVVTALVSVTVGWGLSLLAQGRQHRLELERLEREREASETASLRRRGRISRTN